MKEFCDAVLRLYLVFAGGGGIATALLKLLVLTFTATIGYDASCGLSLIPSGTKTVKPNECRFGSINTSNFCGPGFTARVKNEVSLGTLNTLDAHPS